MRKIKPGKRLKFKRRMMKKTDYKLRLALLKSGLPRLVVRRGNNFVHVQVVNYSIAGDKTVAEVLSKELRKYGWKFHCGSLPAAYLSGMLVALKAKQAGANGAVLDIGLQIASIGSILFGAAKGAKDAGLDIPMNSEIDEKRLRGEHIAEYAKAIKNSEAYKKQFGAYAKAGVDPEQMPQNFDEVKAKILSQFKAVSAKA